MTAGPVTASESAVLVPFPEAERVASPYRARLDGAVALGVPAHVTVLYPFMRCWRDIDGASMPLPGKRVSDRWGLLGVSVPVSLRLAEATTAADAMLLQYIRR